MAIPGTVVPGGEKAGRGRPLPAFFVGKMQSLKNKRELPASASKGANKSIKTRELPAPLFVLCRWRLRPRQFTGSLCLPWPSWWLRVVHRMKRFETRSRSPGEAWRLRACRTGFRPFSPVRSHCRYSRPASTRAGAPWRLPVSPVHRRSARAPLRRPVDRG